jgi:hypothetical protein
VEAAERTPRPLVALRRAFTGVAVAGIGVLLGGILLVASFPPKDLPLTAAVCAFGLWLTLMGLWSRRKATRAIADSLRPVTRAAASELPSDRTRVPSRPPTPSPAELPFGLETVKRRVQWLVRLVLALAAVVIIVGFFGDIPRGITLGLAGALTVSALLAHLSMARLTRRLEPGRDSLR